ncbi:2-polyprenyl-6-methoxyphenol hydroxylase-like FAD-dependent oxidoreductase [Lentzea atacamensis]|uniref:2-polyprenyl-6-methoxyphenol hydroxylase-like FAD-dependent oxidoreductase n=2 Tax=Lentzea atacamensis TaxID=531938 RepID=A0A316IMU7_9PSEU|nr:2-polyprenyl-6-methoxyphenol hydroxylase-like FAD-dependent oxidoreductase [Lentzea atacamensis]
MLSMKTTGDVAVVGAGPVGLLLACELALQGVRTTVLERLTTQADTIKAQMISGRTYQMLAMRGFGSAIDAVSEAESARLAWRPTGATGHFAGLFKLDGLPLVMLTQQALERILEVRALELGVEIHRGVEVTDLGFDAGFIVGCDGGRSTVRKLAGFDFPGTGPTLTGYQAIVDLEGDLPRGWHHTPTGVYACGPLQGRIMTMEYDGPPATRDATRETLEASLRRVSGHDVRITAVHTATVWTDNTRQATTYRRGNVLLAGDAAHVHSPFGGQGLNLGLQDALNLGWKLATGDDALIDTYTTERHPVAARVLHNTMAQVALTRPDPHSRELYSLFNILLDLPDVRKHITAMVQGTDIRYDTGSDDPLAGTFVPGLDLSDGKGTSIALDGAEATVRPDGYIAEVTR